MLSSARRIIAGLLAFIVAGGLLLVGAAPANADAGTWCDQSDRCWVLASSPGVDPPINPDPETGFTPGASHCTYTQLWGVHATVEVPCSTSPNNYWSHTYQCYVSLAGTQGSAPPWATSEDGGWYWCDASVPDGLRCDPAGMCRAFYSASFWSDYPPPGLHVMTPRQAAMRLVRTFQVRGIDIGMAPEVNPAWGHRRGYVGVPVWLWVNNPQPLTWGPYSETATIGGQTITATAQVTGVRWDMGDGHEVVCGSTGTPYSVGYGLNDSPTCGYRFDHTTKNQPNNRYTVTATSQWAVTWTAGTGATGTINLTTTSATDLEVNEIQSVNVKPNTANG